MSSNEFLYFLKTQFLLMMWRRRIIIFSHLIVFICKKWKKSEIRWNYQHQIMIYNKVKRHRFCLKILLIKLFFFIATKVKNSDLSLFLFFQFWFFKISFLKNQFVLNEKVEKGNNFYSFIKEENKLNFVCCFLMI